MLIAYVRTLTWLYTLAVADSPRVTAAAVVCTAVVVCITDPVYYIGHENEVGVTERQVLTLVPTHFRLT